MTMYYSRSLARKQQKEIERRKPRKLTKYQLLMIKEALKDNMDVLLIANIFHVSIKEIEKISKKQIDLMEV